MRSIPPFFSATFLFLYPPASIVVKRSYRSANCFVELVCIIPFHSWYVRHLQDVAVRIVETILLFVMIQKETKKSSLKNLQNKSCATVSLRNPSHDAPVLLESLVVVLPFPNKHPFMLQGLLAQASHNSLRLVL